MHVHVNVRELTGAGGHAILGYLLTTNVVCFTHGTHKIDSVKTNEAWQV